MAGRHLLAGRCREQSEAVDGTAMGISSPCGVQHAFFRGDPNPLKVKQPASVSSGFCHLAEEVFNCRNRSQKTFRIHVGMAAPIDKTDKTWLRVSGQFLG